MEKNIEPKVFVISGPGGVGKTSLLKKLFLKKSIKAKFIKGITCTTREKRMGERHNRDYIFTTKEDFLKKKNENYFIETEKVLENYYGTPRFFYEKAEKSGKNLVLCIDVKGGKTFKQIFGKKHVITIFITAPDEKELKKRMNKRVDSSLHIKKRLQLAKKEIELSDCYDYKIINDDFNDTMKTLESIFLEKIPGTYR
ncbi:MAG: guanylate kinase [Candidatus Omnitrophica bacterium]|nr:guanylate kinase [Candidatus Omnitrophota bacterium]MDD5081369.1 guanylate kinase [Candidatus Omnitrophota bacterium]